MESKRVLLAEDDMNLGKVLSTVLTGKGFVVKHANNGEAAYELFCTNEFDICLIDVMMPLKDGFTLAQEIRKMDMRVPIIFLTAKTMQEDMIKGLSIGGDDYITKPFTMEILLARMQALLRRTGMKEEQENYVVNIGSIHFDRKRQVLIINGEEHKMTSREAACDAAEIGSPGHIGAGRARGCLHLAGELAALDSGRAHLAEEAAEMAVGVHHDGRRDEDLGFDGASSGESAACKPSGKTADIGGRGNLTARRERIASFQGDVLEGPGHLRSKESDRGALRDAEPAFESEVPDRAADCRKQGGGETFYGVAAAVKGLCPLSLSAILLSISLFMISLAFSLE